jgi:tetratricopeptide (TPR) repeat protein
MNPQDDLERYEATEGRELVRLFTTLRPPPVGPAPAHFRAQVLAQVAEWQAQRGWRAWLARVRLVPWVPALATVLLVSLSLNAWLGYQVLEWGAPEDRGFTFRGRPPSGTSPPPEQASLPAAADLVSTLTTLAAKHYRAGQYEPTLHAASTALALDSTTALAYFYRGLAYEGMGDRPRALADMRQAANLGEAQAQTVLRAWGAE